MKGMDLNELEYDLPDRVTMADDKLIRNRMRPWDVKLGSMNTGRKGYISMYGYNAINK